MRNSSEGFFKFWMINVLHLASFLVLFIIASCNPQEVESFSVDVSSVSPSIGSSDGGETIVFEGAGLTYLKSVTIGDENCVDLKIISDVKASCVTLSHDVGDVEIILTNIIGETFKQSFSYVESPKITTVEPRFGPVNNGSLEVTIFGSGFDEGLLVTFGGKECDDVVLNGDKTQITCTVPASSKVGYVQTVIENPTGKKVAGNYFSYRISPTITKITPSGGNPAGGTLVTINGTGFSTGIGVTIGGAPCDSVNVIGAGTLTCITPPNSTGTYSVLAKFSDSLTSGSLNFIYSDPPVVTGFSPVSLPSNATLAAGDFFTVTISGTGFVGAKARIGLTPCDPSSTFSATSITCKIKGGISGMHKIVVTNSDLQTATSETNFTFRANPVITSVTPNVLKITADQEVTIKGSNFMNDPGTVVKIGGTSCSILSIASGQITCKTASLGGLSHGDQVVTLQHPAIQGYTPQATKALKVLKVPVLTSISPAFGNLAGGTLVTVVGENFTQNMVVNFDVIPCTNLEFINSTEVKCLTPPGSGPVPVHLADEVGQLSNVLTPGFTYKEGPTITSVVPDKGRLSGGVEIKITGTNFTQETTVDIAGAECTTVNIESSTELTCLTPDLVAADPEVLEGPVDVVVKNSSEQTTVKQNGYNLQNVILEWDPPTYDFGSLAASSQFTLQLKNSVNADTIITFNLQNFFFDPPVNSNVWSIQLAASGDEVDCENGISPDRSCVVKVTFNPANLPDTTPTSAVLKVRSEDGKYSAEIILSGSKAPPPPAP